MHDAELAKLEEFSLLADIDHDKGVLSVIILILRIFLRK